MAARDNKNIRPFRVGLFFQTAYVPPQGGKTGGTRKRQAHSPSRPVARSVARPGAMFGRRFEFERYMMDPGRFQLRFELSFDRFHTGQLCQHDMRRKGIFGSADRPDMDVVHGLDTRHGLHRLPPRRCGYPRERRRATDAGCRASATRPMPRSRRQRQARRRGLRSSIPSTRSRHPTPAPPPTPAHRRPYANKPLSRSGLCPYPS